MAALSSLLQCQESSGKNVARQYHFPRGGLVFALTFKILECAGVHLNIASYFLLFRLSRQAQIKVVGQKPTESFKHATIPMYLN